MNLGVLQGDAADVLATLDDASIQTTVTSPPYFGLRNYSGGGSRGASTPSRAGAAAALTGTALPDTAHEEIGRESTVAAYVERLVDTFEVLRRKTADDGTLFLNLGDSYVRGELAGVPWRVALALSDAGWLLRSDIVWRKPNAMPSSVKDRPTTDHEYVFMFAKQRRYFYDQDAIREPHVTFTEASKMRGGRRHLGKRGGTPEQGKNSGSSNLHDGRWDQAFHPLGRNRRTVWDIPLGKFRGAHFAVFPEKLVELCVSAGSRPGDIVCDPFAGSGTTGLVAERLGRRFVGAELVPEYVDLANSRLAEARAQAQPPGA